MPTDKKEAKEREKKNLKRGENEKKVTSSKHPPTTMPRIKPVDKKGGKRKRIRCPDGPGDFSFRPLPVVSPHVKLRYEDITSERH